MNLKRTLTFIVAAALFVFIAKQSESRDNFAPEARTGAPGENSCGVGTTGCHNSLPLQNQFLDDLTLTANGDTVNGSFEYEPGTTYSMNFNISNAPARNGFSLTILNANNGFAGSFGIPAGSDAEIRTSVPLSRDYVGHTNSLGVSDWDFEWTAPASGLGDLTIYASANRSNNNGTTSNDSIVAYSQTISEMMTGPSSINFQLLTNDVSLMGNPVHGSSLALEIDVPEPKEFLLQVVDMNGAVKAQSATSVIHGGTGMEVMDVSDLSTGMYFLHVSDRSGASRTIKFMKL